jgi:hypothetical protein
MVQVPVAIVVCGTTRMSPTFVPVLVVVSS